MKTVLSPTLILTAIIAALLVLSIAARQFRFRTRVANDSGLIAVGLRGAQRESKPMSQRQRERFETNFLETPAVPSLASSTPPSRVAEAQSINAFNRKQNR